jgi:hypothetical protein
VNYVESMGSPWKPVGDWKVQDESIVMSNNISLLQLLVPLPKNLLWPSVP